MVKKYSSSKRDYLAKELLFKFLSHESIANGVLEVSKLGNYVKGEALIKKSIYLADTLTEELNKSAPDLVSGDTTEFDPIIPVFDGVIDFDPSDEF